MKRRAFRALRVAGTAPKLQPLLFSGTPASTPPSATSPLLRWAGVALVLALHAWLALDATRGKSTTVDELPHLTAGHVMWERGDYRLQPENGNLPQRWQGLPGFLSGRALPADDHAGWHKPNVWSLGHAYFHQLGNDLAAMLLTGRAMNLVWNVATGILIFCWTRRLFGEAGAWVSLAFFAVCPTLLAHGALATSDLCIAFFMLASVGAYWRHLWDFRAGTGLLSAIVLGLAFVAKFSAVLLIPMLGLLLVARALDPAPLTWRGQVIAHRGRRWLALLGSAAVHALVVWIVIWAFHGFRWAPVNEPGFAHAYTRPWDVVLTSLGSPRADLLRLVREAHVLPDAYLYGFAFVVDMSEMRGAFLNGETSFTGWWYFFPYAFAVKTPLGLLAAGALGVGLGAAWLRRATPDTRAQIARRLLPLVVLFGVYWLVSLTSNLNIGQRHLLPTYPVWIMATGVLGWAAQRWHRAWGVATLGLVAAHGIATLQVRPHFLAFFNVLAGGPAHGYRHLVDSSLDWGQDLPGLARWLDANCGNDRVYLSYFGTGDPKHHGIEVTPMVPLLRMPEIDSWYTLEPGIYCISATMLSQAYSPIRDPWNPTLEKEFQELRALEPLLLDYARDPAVRERLDRELPNGKVAVAWKRYEALRFARLCTALKSRPPDAQIGYSINVYRLDAAFVHAAAKGDLAAFVRLLETPAR